MLREPRRVGGPDPLCPIQRIVDRQRITNSAQRLNLRRLSALAAKRRVPAAT